MRIALFGGSFNPIHEGHLKMALIVLKKSSVHEVWLIPNRVSPLKTSNEASFEDRVALIKAMIQPYRKLKVCTIESTLPQPSKTIHTVKALMKQYPQHTFTWMMGEDQFEQFDQWYESEQLKTLIPFIGLSRSHHQPYSWAYQWIYFNHPASSTAFREQHDLKFIPKRVLKIMLEREVYLESCLTQYMSLKRWKHVLRVKEVALSLANIHHLDEMQVMLSAYLHDVAKGMSEDEMDEWINASSYRNHVYPEYAKHAVVGAILAKQRYGITNKKMIKAIFHHTEGTSTSKLSQCLYVADKIEPQRPQWLVDHASVAKKDLRLAQMSIMKGFSND